MVNAANPQERQAIVLESSETKMLSFPKPERRINRTSLAYIAGLLDGEGTITGVASGKYIRVSIANINKKLIIWVAQTLGGIVMERRMPGKLPLYLWRCNLPDIAWLMKLLIPFMRIKQQQARLAVVFRAQVLRKSPLWKRARTVRKIQQLNVTSGKMIESKPVATQD